MLFAVPTISPPSGLFEIEDRFLDSAVNLQASSNPETQVVFLLGINPNIFAEHSESMWEVLPPFVSVLIVVIGKHLQDMLDCLPNLLPLTPPPDVAGFELPAVLVYACQIPC